MKIRYSTKDMQRFGIHFEDLTGKEVDALRHVLQSMFRNVNTLKSMDTSELGDQAFVNFLSKA